MRHRAVRAISEQASEANARPAKFSSIGLIVMTALVFWLTASAAIANSDTSLVAQRIDPENSARLTALDHASVEGTPEAAQSDSSDVRPNTASQETLSPRVRRPNLAALLAIRSSGNGSSIEKTPDESLADAIALGPRPDSEPKNPFRKRTLDLFRTVHPVSIGNADLLVRFRVRGNMSEMMSFDVRF